MRGGGACHFVSFTFCQYFFIVVFPYLGLTFYESSDCDYVVGYPLFAKTSQGNTLSYTGMASAHYFLLVQHCSTSGVGN